MKFRYVGVGCFVVACTKANQPAVVPATLFEPGSGSASTVTADAALAEPVAQPTADLAALSVSQACQQFAIHANQGCAWAQRFPADFRQPAMCERSLGLWLAPSTPNHEVMQTMVNCWALDCDSANNCMVLARDAAPPPPARTCGEPGNAPILVDAAAWQQRRGANARTFADVTTSVSEPVEVCGIADEIGWLKRMACVDGSRPFQNVGAEGPKRDSWLSRGGRCESVIDRYTVACPEKTYTIHVDRYVCPIAQ